VTEGFKLAFGVRAGGRGVAVVWWASSSLHGRACTPHPSPAPSLHRVHAEPRRSLFERPNCGTDVLLQTRPVVRRLLLGPSSSSSCNVAGAGKRRGGEGRGGVGNGVCAAFARTACALMATVRRGYHEESSVFQAAGCASPVDATGCMVQRGMTRDRPLRRFASFLPCDGASRGEAIGVEPFGRRCAGGGGCVWHPPPPLQRKKEGHADVFGTEGSGLGCMYGAARGEILRPALDNQQQRRSAGPLPSTKNESVGRKDDQIPLYSTL